MVNSITNKAKISTKDPTNETLLTPRFYTTDFEEMAKLDISSNTEEIQAILDEFRADYNQQHFIRDKEFVMNWPSSRMVHPVECGVARLFPASPC